MKSTAAFNTGAAAGAGTFRPALLSAALHAAIIAAAVLARGAAGPARPPAYHIELVGAPGETRRMGVVSDVTPVEVAPPKAPAPAAAERPPTPPKPAPPKAKAKPVPAPKQATPNVTKRRDAGAATDGKAGQKAPPTAGSGSKATRGTDVTNMVADGIEFPYQGYLNNIVRQVKLNFSPPRGSVLVAELRFLIHRDGSVSDIEVLTRSGNSEFDREAHGAIEAVGTSRLFGPLPSGFADDVLPVYFTFAPDKPPSPGP